MNTRNYTLGLLALTITATAETITGFDSSWSLFGNATLGPAGSLPTSNGSVNTAGAAWHTTTSPLGLIEVTYHPGAGPGSGFALGWHQSGSVNVGGAGSSLGFVGVPDTFVAAFWEQNIHYPIQQIGFAGFDSNAVGVGYYINVPQSDFNISEDTLRIELYSGTGGATLRVHNLSDGGTYLYNSSMLATDYVSLNSALVGGTFGSGVLPSYRTLDNFTYTVDPIPEPSTYAAIVAVAGLGALQWVRLRKR